MYLFCWFSRYLWKIQSGISVFQDMANLGQFWCYQNTFYTHCCSRTSTFCSLALSVLLSKCCSIWRSINTSVEWWWVVVIRNSFSSPCVIWCREITWGLKLTLTIAMPFRSVEYFHYIWPCCCSTTSGQLMGKGVSSDCGGEADLLSA